MSAFYCAECNGPVPENGHDCAADPCGYCGCRRDEHGDRTGPCDPCGKCIEWRNP